MSADTRIQAILDHWFGASWDDSARTGERSGLWWGGKEHDADISERYGETVAEAERDELDGWTGNPKSALALVIVVDQYRRNVFRGLPEAFADDERALAISLRAQDEGWDRKLPAVPRVFLYMPMQHAEDLQVQESSVLVFQALADEQEVERRSTFQGFANFAVQHRDLIAQFGRFPHRNRILGREPTAAETAFLDDGGATFGQ